MLVLVLVTAATAPLKVGFMYVGPTNDLGWTYALNQGRINLESQFGDRIHASTYVEGVADGENSLQLSKGSTLLNGVPVLPAHSNGAVNMYHAGYYRLRQFCDEDFDLVFSTSFGFMSQVRRGLRFCSSPLSVAAPIPPNPIHPQPHADVRRLYRVRALPAGGRQPQCAPYTLCARDGTPDERADVNDEWQNLPDEVPRRDGRRRCTRRSTQLFDGDAPRQHLRRIRERG